MKVRIFSTRAIRAAAGGLLILAAGFWVGQNVSRQAKVSASEIDRIKATSVLDEQVQIYQQLIERVGAREAQEQLLGSGLPFTGETHLLNHTVGDYLYEHEGAGGLTKCRDYFLASCYHGFVLRAIGEQGLPAVAEIMAACGSVLAQCAHAVGHGLLTYSGYRQLPEALRLCDQIGRTQKDFPLYNCQDGVFMENIWAVHEGVPSPERWVKPEDPTYPCLDPAIEESYRNACWGNQPALLYQLFERDLKKVGKICEQVADAAHRQTCFNGLARQIHPVAAGNLEKTLELCGLNPAEWVDYCVAVNAVSAFSVGDRDLPYRICAQTQGRWQISCYEQLFSVIRAYAASPKDRLLLCDRIVDQKRAAECKH